MEDDLKKQIEDLKARQAELNTEAKNHRLAAKEAKERLAAYGDIDVEQAKKAIKVQQEADEAKKIEDGKYAELIESLKTKLVETEKKYQDELGGLKKSYAAEQTKAACLSALAGKTDQAEQCYLLMQQNITLQDGKPQIMIEGKVALSEKGENIGISDYADMFIKSNPHFAKSSIKGGAGGGSGSGRAALTLHEKYAKGLGLK